MIAKLYMRKQNQQMKSTSAIFPLSFPHLQKKQKQKQALKT